MTGVRILAGYPEGGLQALVRRLNEVGELEKIIAPSRAINRAAGAILKSVGIDSMSGRLSRGLPDLPALHEVLPAYEPLRMLSRLSRGIGGAAIEATLKAWFDASSSRVKGSSSAVVGLPGAALLNFGLPGDRLKVLHQVDGHPNERNAALSRFYGARARSEMFSRQAIDRIARELELADLVLSPSSVVTTGLCRSGVAPAKIAQHYYGVDLTRFGGRLAPGVRSHSGRPRAVYVGQVSYRKGFPFLLEAARRSTVDVDVVGPVLERNLIKRLPDNMSYHGVVSHEAVARLMASADAFVIASVEDACPLVVFEAAASGLPVIATDACGSAEALIPEDVDVVQAGDSASLAAALSRVARQDLAAREARSLRFRGAIGNASALTDWTGWSDWVRTEISQRVAER